MQRRNLKKHLRTHEHESSQDKSESDVEVRIFAYLLIILVFGIGCVQALAQVMHTSCFVAGLIISLSLFCYIWLFSFCDHTRSSFKESPDPAEKDLQLFRANSASWSLANSDMSSQE